MRVDLVRGEGFSLSFWKNTSYCVAFGELRSENGKKAVENKKAHYPKDYGLFYAQILFILQLQIWQGYGADLHYNHAALRYDKKVTEVESQKSMERAPREFWVSL